MAPVTSPPRQAIEEQLARILASPVFDKSERMSRFLQFIVAKALAGEADGLKEYTIALEVFDKDESFDPRIDPTVRSEARRLRAKLNEYYSAAGAEDRITIDLPKGAYTPSFHERVAPLHTMPPQRALLTRPGIAIVLAAAAVVVLFIVFGWFLRRNTGRPVTHAIAVLPFENLSTDPANEFFSDGLTEEILNALANVPGFKVVARTSSFQFKGKHEDVRTIGKKLNVDTILEGTVRKEGDRIRVTPQLINAADGYHIWSAEYDREWKSLFSVQREIAAAISAALGGRLGNAPRQPLDASTYALYLEARYHFNKWNADGMKKALDAFQLVIARDPDYAPAYAGVSNAYGMLTAFGSDAIPPQESRKKSKEAAMKCIALDPRSADCWASLAPKLVEEFDWSGAENAFHKAIEYGPNSSSAHAWYAELFLTPKGRLNEALRESQVAQTLDPVSAYAMAGVGRRYYFLRQYDNAISWFRRALDLEPAFAIAVGPLIHSYLKKNDVPGARQFLDEASRIWPERSLALSRAAVDAAEGNRAGALALVSSQNFGPGVACQVAGVYASLGENKQAMSWLNLAVERRSACFQAIPAEPRFDSLRGTPEFKALLSKMKL